MRRHIYNGHWDMDDPERQSFEKWVEGLSGYVLDAEALEWLWAAWSARAGLPPREEPTAYMRRYAFNGIDALSMKKEDRPRGWSYYELSRIKRYHDDVALYAMEEPKIEQKK